MKRILSLLLAALMLCPVCTALAADPVPVSKVTLTPNTLSLPVGKTVTLKAEIEPRNATKKTLAWSSSNENIVKVRDGKVTGVASGTATVMAATQDGSGVFAYIVVTVVNPVTKIEPERRLLVLEPDTIWPLYWSVEPADADNRDITWTSSNQRIATVTENGVIRAHGVGSCTLTGTAADGSGTKVTVNVQVKRHDLVITEPGDFGVDFETEQKNVSITIHVAGKATTKNCDRRFQTKNDCVTSPEDMVLRPVKAGSDTVSIVFLEKKKPVKTNSYSVFVAPSAVGESAALTADGEPGPIRFLGLPWGFNYPQSKTLLDNNGRGLKTLSRRNDKYLRAMVASPILFGNITAFSAALNFTYTPDDRMYEVRNSLYKGDLYFDPEIPVESVVQAAKSVYGLGSPQQSGDSYTWEQGHIRIVVTKKSRFTILEVIWDGTEDAAEAEAPDAGDSGPGSEEAGEDGDL